MEHVPALCVKALWSEASQNLEMYRFTVFSAADARYLPPLIFVLPSSFRHVLSVNASTAIVWPVFSYASAVRRPGRLNSWFCVPQQSSRARGGSEALAEDLIHPVADLHGLFGEGVNEVNRENHNFLK